MKYEDRLSRGLKNRKNEIKMMNCGEYAKIIRYENQSDIDIQFEDGTIVHNKQYGEFKRGTIRNYNKKTFCGVGYIGDEKPIGRDGIGGKEQSYITWISMIRRCYNEKELNKHPNYIGCTVCEEWHNYSNFKKWYDMNYYKLGTEKMNLDKDLLCSINKIYSPSTCVFIPQYINTLITRRNNGNYLTGITFNAKRNKEYPYVSRCSTINNNGKICRVYIGNYKTEDEAFYEYKKFKERYVKDVANKYKNKYENFPEKIYKLMYEWKV